MNGCTVNKPRVLLVCCTINGAIVDFTNSWIDWLQNRYEVFALTGYIYVGPWKQRYPANFRSILKGSKRRAFSPGAYISALNWIKEVHPDVVMFCSGAPSHNVLWHALKDYPRIAYVHDPYPHSGMGAVRGGQYRALLRDYYREANKLIFTSDYLRQRVVEDGLANAQRCSVVPLGLLPNHVFNGLDKESKTIDFLFYGRMEYYKGIDTLFSADELLQQDGINTNITVVSKGNIQKIFPSIKCIPSNVIQIKEYVPDAELVDYVRRSKCVVLPYRDATATQIIHTAYYYEVPVLVTEAGALPEYAGGGEIGYIVPPEDPLALMKAMKRILGNPIERERRGRLGAQYLSDNFSKEVLVEQMVKTVNDVLKRK